MMLFHTKLHINICSSLTMLPLIEYHYVQKELCCPCNLCACSIRGPVGNYLFLWPLPEHVTLEAFLSESYPPNVLIYPHPALRKKLISKFRRISPKTSLATIREFYWVATGDQSASLMKDCVKRWKWRTQIWWLTCVNWTKAILISLLRSGRWRYTSMSHLQSSAVDERQHGEITYMAKVTSISDLVQEVVKMCPGKPVPSEHVSLVLPQKSSC